jgi:hypothetical protein
MGKIPKNEMIFINKASTQGLERKKDYEAQQTPLDSFNNTLVMFF